MTTRESSRSPTARRKTKPVPRSELVKGYEYEKDHYVVIEDDDIKKVAPKTAKVMEILEFVKAEQVDPDLPGKLVLHGAGRGRREAVRAAVRGTAGDRSTMRVAKIAMHNREHMVILRPGSRGFCCTRCTTRTRSGRWTSSAPTPAW